MGTQAIDPSSSDVIVVAARPDAQPSGVVAQPGIPSTRAARTWTRVLPALVLLAITLVFVFQNLQDVKVSFLGFSGRFPLGAALLVAAALGSLVLLALGSVRILQLRKLVRRSSQEPPAAEATPPG